MRYTTITFPGLGLELNPPSTLELGPLSIHLYGLIIACGLLAAAFYGMRRAKEFGLNDDLIVDGVLWVTPFAILCARLYYCAFQWEHYASNPISILYIWEGGLAIYGGVIGAALGIIVFTKIKKINVFALLDLVSIGFLIGQAAGRWGNFFNREAFGSETDNFLRMGLYDAVSKTMTYHHPTFFYESALNLLGFVVLHFASKRRKFDGQIALGYLAWYGAVRFSIEGLRTDSLYIPGTGIRVSQLLALVSFSAAAIALIYFAMKPQDPANLYVNRVAAAQETEEDTTEGGENNE